MVRHDKNSKCFLKTLKKNNSIWNFLGGGGIPATRSLGKSRHMLAVNGHNAENEISKPRLAIITEDILAAQATEEAAEKWEKHYTGSLEFSHKLESAQGTTLELGSSNTKIQNC